MKTPIRFTFFDADDQPYYKNVEIPLGWGDVTLGQLLAIKDLPKKQRKQKRSLIKILTGMTNEEINASSDIGVWDEVENLLLFLSQPLPDIKGYPVPNHVTIDGKQYTVPVDLRVETFGQKISLEELARSIEADEKGEADMLPIMPEALAIYFYPKITGEKFNDEKVELYVDTMKQLPIKHALPIAGFFLANYTISYLMKESGYLQNQQTNRSGQGSASSTSTEH